MTVQWMNNNMIINIGYILNCSVQILVISAAPCTVHTNCLSVRPSVTLMFNTLSLHGLEDDLSVS